MSLLNSYNKNIKIVYNGVYHGPTGPEFLLNGTIPEVNAYVLEQLNTNQVKSYIGAIQKLKAENTEHLWSGYISHRNFYDYYKEFYGLDNVITADQIVADGTTYLYPIEVCFTLDYFGETYKLKIGDVEYTHNFLDTIDKKVLLGLRLGYVKIVLNYIHDPLENTFNIKRIEDIFNKFGIPSDSIIVIGGNSLDSYYEEYPDNKVKITNGYVVLDQLADKFYQYPQVGSLGYKSDYVKVEDLDKNYIRSKRFICLNRNMHRAHRWLSPYIAAKYNLLNNSIFSFVDIHDFDRNKIRNTIQNFINYEGDDLEDIADIIAKNVPKEIDTFHLPQGQKNGFQLNNNNKNFYAETYINIVSETSFNKGGGQYPFITEKTFHHPIINLQPFVVIGNPFLLQTLRDLGFKTFNPIINEDYDKCLDYRQRFKLIEKEIAKLAKMPIKELHDLYYQLTDITIHNQDHAKTFNDFNPFEKAFEDIRSWYLK